MHPAHGRKVKRLVLRFSAKPPFLYAQNASHKAQGALLRQPLEAGKIAAVLDSW